MEIRVTCAIIERQGRVLVTQRSEKMREPLLWEFPGGKMEVGETEEECLTREIWEELHLRVQPLCRLTPVPHGLENGHTLVLIPYRCACTGGSLQLLEHSAYQWATPAELPRFNWCAPDLPVVAEYLQLLKGK